MNTEQVGTQFPVLEPAGSSADLGALTWHGNMACQGAVRECTNTTRFAKGEIASIPGGLSGGFPIVIFDDSSSQNSLVISPASNFMAGSHVYTSGALAAGLLGSITSIPPGYSYETIVWAGQGVNSAMTGWGRSLLTHYGKVPISVPSDRDRTVDYLTYYTDNG